jgi:hypothetical protein
MSLSNIVVLDMNDNLQKAGKALTSAKRREIESRTTLENIEEATDALKVCHFMAQTDFRNICVCWDCLIESTS